jgi:hypothetical protein
MSIGRVAAIASLWLGATACSSSGPPIGGANSKPCTGAMSEVAQSCPATFSGDLESVTCVPRFMLGTFSCEGLTTLILSGGFTGVWCVYDSTTHALVGAQLRTDYNGYCDGASFTETAGKVPSAACLAGQPDGGVRECPSPADGGMDVPDAEGVSQ